MCSRHLFKILVQEESSFYFMSIFRSDNFSQLPSLRERLSEILVPRDPGHNEKLDFSTHDGCFPITLSVSGKTNLYLLSS